MFDFLIVQVIILAFDGYCLALLLSYLIPVDPAILPRAVAWLQAGKGPKPGDSIPSGLYRWGMRLMAVVILTYTQYTMVRELIVSPTWSAAYGPVRLIGFFGVEALVIAWTAYVYWTFRRAANRPG